MNQQTPKNRPRPPGEPAMPALRGGAGKSREVMKVSREDQPEPAGGGAADRAKPQKPAPAVPARPHQAPPTPRAPVRPVAQAARIRRRHRGLLFSFVLCVLLPAAATTYYMYEWATDQYASSAGFTVRSEDISSAIDVLGGITNFSNSSSSDTDVLYEFIQSQELVARIDAKLDLRRIYSRPENDPVFAYHPPGSIEDLVDYWGRMVRIYYDSGTGLIELRVLAFRPEDAQAIAQEIFAESSQMINELSAIAREDATRYARAELEQAVERLKQAREAITAYRSRTQIVDPNADIQSQMGLLNTMQQQLAEATIELAILRDTTREGDPRVAQAERRIAVIEDQIAEERRKFGIGGAGPGGEDYATLVAEFERLTVDREFAEEAYKLALSNFDAAQAEAQRQSRYLAAYIRPTLAESSKFPERAVLSGLTALFLFLVWAIGVLIYYSVRDRR